MLSLVDRSCGRTARTSQRPDNLDLRFIPNRLLNGAEKRPGIRALLVDPDRELKICWTNSVGYPESNSSGVGRLGYPGRFHEPPAKTMRSRSPSSKVIYQPEYALELHPGRLSAAG